MSSRHTVIADDKWNCNRTNCDSDDEDEIDGRKHPDYDESMSADGKRRCREEWKDFHNRCCGYGDSYEKDKK